MDDFYDPDLEARLYAEVHYTNDTYAEPGSDLPKPGESPAPGSIRSYAKKTGMFPKKHRALIDGIRAFGAHRPHEDFRSNQDSLRSIPPLMNPVGPPNSVPPRFGAPAPLILARLGSPNPPGPPRFPPAAPSAPPRFSSPNPPNPPRFSSPNPSNLLRFGPPNPPAPPRFPPLISSTTPRFSPSNSSIPPRFSAPNPVRFNLLDPRRPVLFGNYPQDYDRFGVSDPKSADDRSRIPPLLPGSNIQRNPFASDALELNLTDPYSDRQPDSRSNQPDFIRLSQPSSKRSKSKTRKDPQVPIHRPHSNKVRRQQRRDKKRRKIALKKAASSPNGPRKNPNRAARVPDLNKSGEVSEGTQDLNDSVEIIEIQESTDDNLAQSDRGSQSSDGLEESGGDLEESFGSSAPDLGISGEGLENSGSNLDKSCDTSKTQRNYEKSNKNSEKSDHNLDKSEHSLEKSKNLKTANRSSDKSNKNLEKSDRNLDNSDHNLEQNPSKFKNLRTPTRNSDKSDHNLAKSDQSVGKSDYSLAKSKNSRTPSRNSDKSYKNSAKSDHNLDKSDCSLEKSKVPRTPIRNSDKSTKNSNKSDQNLDKSDQSPSKSKNSEPPTRNSGKSGPNLSQPDIQELPGEISSPRGSKSGEKTDRNSKYSVTSSKKSRKSIARLDSSSDSESDESILEVPVPPKPAPPVINLNDSDESSDSRGEEEFLSKGNVDLEDDESSSADELEDNPADPAQESFVTIDSWSAEASNSSKGENSSSHEGKSPEKQIWDCEDEDEEDPEKPEDVIETNFVLNCSQVQKTVPTLAELKRISLEDSADPMDAKVPGENPEGTPGGEVVNPAAGATPGSEKKRPREEANNREENLKPIKIPRSDKNTSFEEYLLKPMPEPLKSFYSEYRGSGCMNDVRDIQSQMSRNPNRWAILDVDLVCRGGEKRPRCSFCHQPGHKRENCPDKKKPAKCYMCGEDGHLESRCPQKMCLTCGKKYSSYRKTCENCRKLHCALCKGTGHLKTNCPDLWRRYHQTTSADGIKIPADPQKVLKPPQKLNCCNCTRRGHDSSTCSRYRWSSHFPSPSYVTNYTDGPTYPIRTVEQSAVPPELPIQSQFQPQASGTSMEPQFQSQNPPQFQPQASGTAMEQQFQPEPLGTSTEPQFQPPPPGTSSEVLFHYRNHQLSSENWPSEILFPHEVPNTSYTRETKQRPSFLSKHFPPGCPYPIEVKIQALVPNKLVVELKTPTAPSTLVLKRLFIQWMSRRAVDRRKMAEVKGLPTTKSAILTTLQDKFYNFITNSSMRGLTAYDELFVPKKPNPGRLKNQKGKKQTGNLEVPKFISENENRYLSKLLSSLYNFKLAPSAESIVNDFKNLLDSLAANGDIADQSQVPQWIYMSFCWFNFEIFTVHLSDYLVQAKNAFLEQLKDAKARNISKSKLSEELNLKLMFTRSERHKFRTEKCLQHISNSKKGNRKRMELNKAASSGSGNRNGSESSSLIVDGKINQQLFQKEKLASRAQAAADLAKKHGLESFADRADQMVKKIKDGGMVKKGAIEQLWGCIVKEMRGRNANLQS